MDFPRKQIEDSLDREVCSGWDRGFLESIITQADRGRTLSSKQMKTLRDVLARNDEEAQQQHRKWHADYEEQYKEVAKIVAAYYSRTPYYTAMSREILNDQVPARKPFLKMIHNKYAQKIVKEYNLPPRFSKGEYVAPRANCDSSRVEFDSIEWSIRREAYAKFAKNGGFIMEARSEIVSAAKGARRYKILAIGSSIPFIVEERFLKVKRK